MEASSPVKVSSAWAESHSRANYEIKEENLFGSPVSLIFHVRCARRSRHEFSVRLIEGDDLHNHRSLKPATTLPSIIIINIKGVARLPSIHAFPMSQGGNDMKIMTPTISSSRDGSADVESYQ